MQAYLLKMLMEIVLERLSEDVTRSLMDKLLDQIEDFVEKSDTEVDDLIILPLCQLIRKSFNIED